MPNTKNLLIASLVLIVVASACRKKELEDEFYTWVKDPVIFDPDLIESNTSSGSGKCNNGQYDFFEGEGDVDCGDACVPCNFTTPCLDEYIDQFFTGGAALEFLFDKKYDVENNGLFLIFNQRSEETIKIKINFSATVLDVSNRKLTTTNDYAKVDSNVCCISYRSLNSDDFITNEDFNV